MSGVDRSARAGLSSAEAQKRLLEHGRNALPPGQRTPVWRRFLRQFRSPLIYILLLALAFEVFMWLREGQGATPLEALAIAAILLLNSVLGTLQELRSEKAIVALRALSAPNAWVLRDGHLCKRPVAELVPGDVVRLEAGERVHADGVFLEASGVAVDESVLTGESLPVDKTIEDAGLSGSLVVRGRGHLLVERTGSASNMGRLAGMLDQIHVEETPLERRMATLGNRVARYLGVLTVAIAIAGVAADGLARFSEVIVFALALAVAAVPEGLPAVVTLTLALGVQRMVKRHAVVRRLSSVETLGSVTVIATDKTGTLTENRMVVRELIADRRSECLLAMALASDADPSSFAGDPLELALFAEATRRGLDVQATRAAHPRSSSRPFDSAWKFMRVTVGARSDRDDVSRSRIMSYLKGAPEALFARSALEPDVRLRWAERAEQAANAGHRVLALAQAAGEREEGLELLGLVLLWDPPRAEVKDALTVARNAGIRVIMVTGDHPGTARAVASSIGLAASAQQAPGGQAPDVVLTGAELSAMAAPALAAACARVNVFARVTPEQKLRLVEALQRAGEVVAMTGDGVNDAPALKRADIGVAMGQRGSDVAREVSDLVLLDDNFATIVAAVEEGRSIYENIHAFLLYTFSTNVALVLVVLAGAIGSYVLDLRDNLGMLVLPLTALQLLWINFLGDGPPALALAFDKNPHVMADPPRPPKSELLDRTALRFIGVTGAFKGLLGACLLVALPALGYALYEVRTAIFLFESIGKLVAVYPARDLYRRPSGNLILHGLIVLGVGLQVLTVTLPGLRALLGLQSVDGRLALMLMCAVLATYLFSEASNRLLRRARNRASVRARQ